MTVLKHVPFRKCTLIHCSRVKEWGAESANETRTKNRDRVPKDFVEFTA
jgi:hypothetical protein